jgi:hypothetical protein
MTDKRPSSTNTEVEGWRSFQEFVSQGEALRTSVDPAVIGRFEEEHGAVKGRRSIYGAMLVWAAIAGVVLGFLWHVGLRI